MTNPVASLAALLRERAMKLISDNSLSISRADPAALAHGKAAGLYEAAAEIEARGVREPLEFCEMSDGSRMPACEGHPTGEAVKANMRAGAAPPREPPWPFAGRFRDMSAEELLLRKLLWLRHGCPSHTLYGDDGEMQCGQCMLDFRRMDVRDIEARFFELGLANAARIVAKEKS